ncbi:MAG TPA: TIGR00296 family protein [Methanobacterium sp.]|nr:TIGR00296 family protein [Methanobacterium sp.]
MITDSEGGFLIKLARRAIETYLKDKMILTVPEDTPESLKDDMGVFVTLNSNGQLRGCIGYPEPIKPLVNAVIEVAISAAIQDPRFPPVSSQELDNIDVEVSVLTKPQIIKVNKPSEYPEKIKVGVDGLIMESSFCRGLLLPQVAVEWQWNVEEFLSNTCMKAGLNSDCWLDPDIKVYKFQSQIFEE